MRFEPVFLSPDRVPDRAISMTRLKHYQGCPRAGFFALEYDAPQNVRMLFGSMAHRIFEKATNLMLAEGESTVPGELVKVLVAEELADSQLPVAEHDRLREQAYRWAEHTTINPARTVAVEQLVSLEIGGWRLRCKLDYAELGEDGLSIRVDDYKTSPGAPAYDELGRKRPGTEPGSIMAAKEFQLVCYALAAAFGEPVRVDEEPCLNCDSAPEAPDFCTSCAGTGWCRVETLDPTPLAGAVQRFDLRLVFPGIKSDLTGMVYRSLSLTRLELAEYRESIEVTLANLERSIETGDWPALQGDEACKECPAKKLCPIPRELHDHAGEINTVEELCEASEVFEQVKAEQSARRAEIAAFIKGHKLPEVRFGATKAWRTVYSESERIERRDEMWEAIERAVMFGEPFDKRRFVRLVGSTSLKVVDLTPDELAEPEEV